MGILRAAALAAATGASLALSGCAGAPKGVLRPVAAAAVPGAHRTEILVVTNRRSSDDPGVMYTGERGQATSYASLTVSIPPDGAREVGKVQWPRELPGNPATDFVTVGSEPLTAAALRDRAGGKAARTGRRNVLVFVHGFNSRFEDAVYRFAQIVHDSGAEVAPVLFTWPSRGSILSYGYDRESTNYSRNALEGLLRDLARDPRVGQVTVLAHSMGNWLVLESLRQMAIREGRVPAKISDVMLAAPDVDVDLAGEAFRDMGPNKPHLTLMTSQDDNALLVSRFVWGDVRRLGAIDPKAEPYRSELAKAGVSVVDLTKVEGTDALSHGKFASNAVVGLIGRRLATGQAITDSRIALGDRIVRAAAGAAGTVGTAGALVVSAPLAIVDEGTRASYGDHLQGLGAGIADTAGAAADLAAEPGRALVGR